MSTLGTFLLDEFSQGGCKYGGGIDCLTEAPLTEALTKGFPTVTTELAAYYAAAA